MSVRPSRCARVNEILPTAATGQEIILKGTAESRIILTQDMDFSALIAFKGSKARSLISLRLSSSRGLGCQTNRPLLPIRSPCDQRAK